MSNWCRASSIYVPCFPQRHVMCALAATGTMITWMVYYSGYSTFRDVIDQPYEEESSVRDRSFNTSIIRNEQIKQNEQDEQNVQKSENVYWSGSMRQSAVYVFWFSYAVSSAVSGIAADMVGPRHVWGLGALVAAVTSIITPHMAKVSPTALFVVLVFCGIGFGVRGPCSSVLVAYWAPENERTTFVAFIESAATLGVMFDFVLHKQSSVWGRSWESWLYVSSVLNLVWICVWCNLFYNRPAEHPYIPLQQLQYLETTTAGVQPYTRMRVRNTPIVPWKAIFLSPPFLALRLLNVAISWVESILFYQISSYMVHVFNARSMVIPGTYMTGMGLGITFSSLLVHGWISDQLISKGLTSRTVNRRLFLLFSNYISAILFMVIPLLGNDSNHVIVAFFLLAYFQALGYASRCANAVDLSPRYAGLLRGVLTAEKAITISFCGHFVKFLVQDLTDSHSWNLLFHISAAMLIILSSPYLCFGSGEIQEWNHLPERRTSQVEPVQSPVQSPTDSEHILEGNPSQSRKSFTFKGLFSN